MALILGEQTGASVTTPATGEQGVFTDSADGGKLKRKTPAGTIVDIEGAASGVTSFNTRTGAVVSLAGDYTAALVTNTPSGTIASATVQGAINELDAEKISVSEKGAALGVATLGADSKVPVAQLPSLALGGLSYQGTWNASGNVPALASSVGTKGFYFVVATAGTTPLDGINDWQIGDWAVFNGLIWEKIDNTDLVTSVNGQTGVVVITKADVLLSNVDNTSDLNKPVSTAQAAADAAVQAFAIQRSNHTGSQLLATVSDVTVTAANVNAIQSGLDYPGHFHASDRNRANHTGVQSVGTITGLAAVATSNLYQDLTAIGLSNNVVSADITVPSGFTLTRQNKTIFTGMTKITINAGGKLTFLG